jgi:hypothetical protein
MKGIWTQANQRWHNGGIISGSKPAAVVAPAVRHAVTNVMLMLFLLVFHLSHDDVRLGLLLAGRRLDGLGLPALFLCVSHLSTASAQPSLGVVAGDFSGETGGIMALLGGVRRRLREQRSPWQGARALPYDLQGSKVFLASIKLRKESVRHKTMKNYSCVADE